MISSPRLHALFAHRVSRPRSAEERMPRGFAVFVLLAMLLGILIGWICREHLAPGQLAAVTASLSLVTEIFLRLIQMIIAPLVLTTLIAGLGSMESAAAVGRIGVKTMAWFLAASVVSLGLGLFMVQWLQPGRAALLAAVGASTPTVVPSLEGFSFKTFVEHLIPTSITEAMAQNEILQIVAFALFAGTAVAHLNGRARQVVELADQIAATMLKITGYIMKLAPLAIFASLAAAVAGQGLPVLVTYGRFVGGFYLSLVILWSFLVLAAALVVRAAALPLLAAIGTPALIAFSCASSEVAYPKLIEALPRVGIPPRIGSFVLPLGYSFNLDGSMMYCTFAIGFIVQMHGVQLSVSQRMAMALMLLITSKGIAAVPRASLVVIMATLSYLGLPTGWIALVLAVDHLLDMGRSGTNVIGNSVAAAVVARWEDQFDPPPKSVRSESAP
jgi:Na+/H+-dicarboxylate symporter